MWLEDGDLIILCVSALRLIPCHNLRKCRTEPPIGRLTIPDAADNTEIKSKPSAQKTPKDFYGVNPQNETRRKDALCIEREGKMARMAKWRRHTVEFKRQVVERMKACENIQSLARELELERKLLYTWKYQLEGRPEPRHAHLATTAEERKDKQLRDEIAKLKPALA